MDALAADLDQGGVSDFPCLTEIKVCPA